MHAIPRADASEEGGGGRTTGSERERERERERWLCSGSTLEAGRGT